MEGDGSPLSSLCMVRAAELFPKPEPEKEDESLKVTFAELPGEFVRYIGRTDDGVLALSNYRICKCQTTHEIEISIPLGVVEYVTTKDLFQLVISCKDASTFKCSFSTSEQCLEWQRRITLASGVPTSLESLFAFSYYAWASELPQIPENEWIGRMQRASNYDDDFRKEVKRLEFNINTTWRISNLNSDFKLCPSYPRLLLVPCCITDDTLLNVASFRSSRRIPSVVWRHKSSGAILARCSQPEVGWLGWRNPKDEQLLKAIADACAFDSGEQVRRQQNTSTSSENSSTDGSHEEVCMDEVKKVLIVDARSYASAVTNRARGGGCECPEYYPCAQIEFMSLGNIHVIRKSFHALRQLCSSPADSQNWFTSLDRTMWLTHVASMLQATMTICHAIEREGRPVLVHCSDGWDRTPQLVATAQLCLDPYYRTVEGFRILVEREWLSFGHKFADRIGHGPGSDETNERCPVFVQWLDCVHQIQKQFPCSFEFSMGYLIKLAQHVFSCMFGTFLCNTYKERMENSVFDRTYSVWPFLSGPMYKNPLYVPNREQVLWPAYHLSNMSFWTEVYTSSFGNQNLHDSSTTINTSPIAPVVASATGISTTIGTPSTNDISNSEPRSPMIKTRSYGDLQTAGNNGLNTVANGLIRRSSDPNMTVDAHFNLNLSSEPSIETLPEYNYNGIINTNVINDQTIAIVCSDTSRELNNLTEELQHSDLSTRCKTSIQENNTCQNNSNSQVANELDIDLPYTDCLRNQDNGYEFSHGRHTNTSNYGSDTRYSYVDDNNDKCNNIEQDHESSPYYAHLSQDLRNNLNNLTLRSAYDGYYSGAQSDNSDTVDGSHFTGSTDDNGDINGMPACMLQSVDLRDTSQNNSPINSLPTAQTFWHGSVETSTDTLVPVVETVHANNDSHDSMKSNTFNGTVAEESNKDCVQNYLPSINSMYRSTDARRIVPEVHSNSKAKTWPTNHSNSTNSIDESIIQQLEHQRMENTIENNNTVTQNLTNDFNGLPLYRRRRNSSNSRQPMFDNQNGLLSRTYNNGSISPNATYNSRFSTPVARSLSLTPPVASRPPIAPPHISSAVQIKCPDGLAHALSEQNLRLQQLVHEHKLREEALQKELHAIRLALLRKTTCSNCNNCLPNATDETEDVMVNEDDLTENDSLNTLSGRRSESPTLRLAYSVSRSSPRSAASIVDNGVENVSVCSWEAVEDRSATSSLMSSMQPLSTSSSVLWVPDHAVSRCTGCQTEFWLGRRKHHCRSCGQIFCADCSEFAAALPDERLYTPVRLCGPCYHNVTTKIQIQQQNRSINLQQSQQSQPQIQPLQSQSLHQTPAADPQIHHPPSIYNSDSSKINSNDILTSPSSSSSSTPTATTTLEPCKHAAGPNSNGRCPLKTTTATN